MMSNLEAQVRSLVERSIREHVMPGAVVGVVTRGGERLVLPFGGLTYESNAPRVSEETMYDVASVTKSIPGSAILLKLLDEGKIRLDDRLVEYIPEFDTDPVKREVRLRHILTYTLDLDLPSFASLAKEGADEIMRRLFFAPLKSRPGEHYVYANSTATFIHLIAERVTGKRVDQLAEEWFFAPLHMKQTTFHPEHFLKASYPPSEITDERGEVRGEVHDEGTHALQAKHLPVIAGLFSSAPDLLNYAEMLLSGGEKNGTRFFSEAIVREMGRNQIDPVIGRTGLGWEFDQPFFMGSHSAEIFGKTGFTGCAVMISPSRGAALVILSNATYPKRPPTGAASARNALRRDLADMIFSEFTV